MVPLNCSTLLRGRFSASNCFWMRSDVHASLSTEAREAADCAIPFPFAGGGQEPPMQPLLGGESLVALQLRHHVLDAAGVSGQIGGLGSFPAARRELVRALRVRPLALLRV